MGIHSRIPPTLYCDNVSAIYPVSNPIFHSRTHHNENDYDFLREQVVQGQLHIVFVGNPNQLVDVLPRVSRSLDFTYLDTSLLWFLPQFSLWEDGKDKCCRPCQTQCKRVGCNKP